MKSIQKLYLPNLTQVLQCIDRHIGVRYKSTVYCSVRSENMKRLLEDKWSTPCKLGALAKKVIITKTVGDPHDRICRSGDFRRSFIATGT